jgi:phage-related protein
VSDKPLLWLGSCRADVRAFPSEARRITGYELRRVQQGLDPRDWKSVSSIGTGVREIRVHTGREHRVLYIASFVEGVYILHAFEKRGRKTQRQDLEIARKRLGALRIARRTGNATEKSV